MAAFARLDLTPPVAHILPCCSVRTHLRKTHYLTTLSTPLPPSRAVPSRDSSLNFAIMSSTFPPPFQNHHLFLTRNDQPDPTLADTSADTLSPQQLGHFGTPGASSTGPSPYSDLSDNDDPFFGAEGNSFLEGEHPDWDLAHQSAAASSSDTRRNAFDPSGPLTPEPTASIYTNSPRSELRAPINRPVQDRPQFSISPQELQKPFRLDPIITQSSQLTPSQSSSGRSSEDGLAPAPAPFNMHASSPRISVSVWDQDDNAPHTVPRSFAETPSTLRGGGIESAGDLISLTHEDQQPTSVPRDAMGRWHRDSLTGQGGLDPRRWPTDEVPSINETANLHEVEERNQDVSRWLSNNHDGTQIPPEKSSDEELQILEKTLSDDNDHIPLGSATENRVVPGQTYIDVTGGGQFNDQDRQILARDRNWSNAAMEFPIRSGIAGEHQPISSQDAIQRFEKMCRDSDAMSRAATWGTRRRSIHSVADLDMDGILGGGLFKKLSLNRGNDQPAERERGNKSGSILKDMYAFVRRPSISSLRKRRGSGSGDDIQEEPVVASPQEKRDSLSSPHLAPPPDRSSSWGKSKKGAGGGVTAALESFAANFTNLGSPDASSDSRPRKTSFSGPSPVRSGLGSLKVNNTLKRPRSRSEAPKPTSNTPDSHGSHSNLVEMWKGFGGPPVASLNPAAAAAAANAYASADNDEDEDDDDDNLDEGDMKFEANLIDNVEANFAGFQSHVLMLNPQLDDQQNSYLVDRIAQHQVVRYKTLLNLKVKHLNLGANCPCASLCMALGGQANILDQKGDGKGMEQLANQYIDDDDTGTPTDGAINQDSFPPDIPLPPAQSLPAEFECQLCYSKKKFQKPSDWTKHVHEDVQPFTCTWERCRDAKSFKRKADWVRHENEGHRQLEWWTCDVDECRHTCYRRDNFLQHLVREHKFPEPKVKTKAAIKKATTMDPTWQRVEKCHEVTAKQPQQEPCRFCGKTFLTWKKLTVHLAKHMEQISLPVLRLVEAKAKEISADTIISPVRDPPPRPSIPVTMNEQMAMGMDQGGQGASYLTSHGPVGYAQAGPPYIYDPVVMPDGTGYYNNPGSTVGQSPMGVGQMGPHSFAQPSNQMHHMPPASSTYGQNPAQYTMMAADNNSGGLEPFPAYDGLGLHNAGPSGTMRPQMGYSNMMDHSAASASPFSGQGSVSPYAHSPNLHPTTTGDNVWDERQLYR